MDNITRSVKHCPKCGAATFVRNSRLRKAKWSKVQRLARRRVCSKCAHAYGTVEILEREYTDLMRFKQILKKVAEEL